MGYTIRPLVIEDLDLYRSMRLKALKTDPGVFRRSFEEEAAMPVSVWIERLTNPRGTIFGLFDGLKNLVGITAIIIEEGHGYLTHSYIVLSSAGKAFQKFSLKPVSGGQRTGS